jgi:hypothetical protein
MSLINRTSPRVCRNIGFRAAAACLIAVWTTWISTVDVSALCAPISLKWAIQSDASVDVVFRGRVTSVSSFRNALPGKLVIGEAATFQVQEVWKGEVGKALVIHHSLNGSLTYTPLPTPADAPPGFVPGMRGSISEQGPRFIIGREYVVVAKRLSATERVDLGFPLDPPDMFGVDPCSYHSPELAIDLNDVGPGREPR